MNPYLQGLLPAERTPRDWREEVVPEADQHALPHRLRESAWEERAVLDQGARAATRYGGGHLDSRRIIDESGGPKQGQHSAGVARHWGGQVGKVANCQGGVVAALGRRAEAPLLEERLFLPAPWTADPTRCQAAGIPPEQRDFKRKHDWALEMITQVRQQGIGLAGVGVAGVSGRDPAFLRTLEDPGEMFVGAVHQEQRLYRADPQPLVPPPAPPRGRPPTCRQAPPLAVPVARWAYQPPAAWQRVTVRAGTKGPVPGDRLQRRGWLWEGTAPQARQGYVLVRREGATPTAIK